jgi:hypothetical protein
MILESLIVIKRASFIKIGGFNENIDYAEGRQFAEMAQKFGLVSVITRDPVYYFSFRRFRKFGTLKIMKDTATLGLSNLLGQDYKKNISSVLYPMEGGALFNKPKRAKNKFLKNIQKLFKDF